MSSAGRHRNARVSVAGVDVGGERKGFHAVALSGGQYADRFATTDAKKMAEWCRKVARVMVIAVDAPCGWSLDGRARPSERELMKSGIWCFSTPTRQRALEHPKNHFGWMRQGEAFFKAISPSHPLCKRLPLAQRKCAFETFPHAITWHLNGGKAKASQKRRERRALLQRHGIDLTELTNIDYVDAALCALTAHHAATGKPCAPFGEPKTGLIITPARRAG